jgi:hypothetical protein
MCKLSCSATLTQRVDKSAKCTTAMTHYLLFRDVGFTERLVQLG